MNKTIDHIRYKKITGNGDFFFHISSKYIDEDAFFIFDNKIENICLSQYEGYTDLDLAPILSFPWIKNLRVYVENIDLRGLEGLSNLTNLSIGEKYKNLQLAKLADLHTLYLVNGKFSGLEALDRLKDLTVICGNETVFNNKNFSDNSSIESLSILTTKGKIDFSFLRKLNRLKQLELYNVKSEIDFALFDGFAKTLVELRIEKCKYIRRLEESLINFDSLKFFGLVDSVTISGVEFLSKMVTLEILVLLGSSYAVNGDISSLMRLRHVSIDDKRHYSHKSKDLPKLSREK